MKKVAKIVSVALVLVLVLSSMMISSVAAPASPLEISAEVVATLKTGTIDGKADSEYYQFDVYLESSLPLCAFQMYPVWERSAWKYLKPNDQHNPTSFMTPKNAAMEKGMAKTATVYTAESAFVAPANDPAVQANGGAYMDDSGSCYLAAQLPMSVNALISNTNLGKLVDTHLGFNYTWMNDFANPTLNLSGTKLSVTPLPPTAGKQLVMSFCLQPLVHEGIHEVGFVKGEKFQVTGSYCANNAIDSTLIGPSSTTITSDMVTYKNAMVNLGGEVAPTTGKLTKTAAFVKEVNGDAFKMKVRSSITEADMNELLAAKSLADVKTGVTSVGFVVTNDATWTEAEAVKAIKGEALTGSARYAAGKTNVVYQADGKYNFGAILDSSRTNLGDGVKYRAFIEFADGSYEFYAADETLTAAQVNQALGAK